MKNVQENRFIASVKVGAKGQITIPVEARNMFDIKEGDTLMVMGDINRGLALVKSDEFYKLMGDFSNACNKFSYFHLVHYTTPFTFSLYL